MELFTPGNETTVMILCDVEIKHVGSSLSGADGQVISDTAVTLEAKTTDSYDVRVVRVVLKDNTNICAYVILIQLLPWRQTYHTLVMVSV